MHMIRHLWRASRLSLAILAALCSVPLALRAQSQPKADAEVLRKGYDTYKAMRQASPFRSTSWMYVGPTNVSGRATDIAVADMPRPALFLAGQAFKSYRRRGGIRTSVLPDFFIGAHAAVLAAPLITRDASRYASYFPALQLIAPDAASR